MNLEQTKKYLRLKQARKFARKGKVTEEANKKDLSQSEKSDNNSKTPSK